jgi:diguanylate cyclase (GGDEF)-like protein
MIQPTSTQQPTILIVDDQPIVIQSLSNLLRNEYRILAATNGSKALELVLGNNRPDVIVLDITMPEMSGYEVCRRLKSDEQTKNIPIIFITALDSSEDEERSFNLGAADYISKPFKPAVVRVRIRNQVNLKLHTDMLERYALMDGLTRLANRHHFDEVLLKEWKSCVRTNTILSLLMIDIDSFKTYNDNYGHGAGDDCLRLLAAILKRCVHRPADMVARYGGEEIVATLPDTDGTGAAHVAQRMLRSVNDLNIPHAYSYAADHVTISIGGASARSTQMSNHELLLEHADRALYTAKKHGGNQFRDAPIA